MFVTMVSTLINSAISCKNRTEHYTSAVKSSRVQNKVKERMDKYNATVRRDVDNCKEGVFKMQELEQTLFYTVHGKKRRRKDYE